MKILFLGDVMGRAGRQAVVDHLPRLRKEWRLDFVVVNRRECDWRHGAIGRSCTDIAGCGG